MTQWKPSGNKIMVRMDPTERKTSSGIIIHHATSEREEMSQMTGTVVAMGPLAFHDQKVPWIKVGDRVKITKFGGWLHKEVENGEEVNYRVLHDLDVIMVLEGEENE